MRLPALLILLSSFFACGERAAPRPPEGIDCRAPGPRPVGIIAAGSGANLALVRALASRWVAREPQLHVVVPESIGTSGALRALRAGAIDLGLASRPLTDDERGEGFVETPLARVAYAPTVRAEIQAGPLTARELAAIFDGEPPASWPPAVPLVPVLREARDSGSQLVVHTFPEVGRAVEKARAADRWLVRYTDQEMRDTLLAVEGSIGFLDAATPRLESLPLRSLAIDGIEPTAQNVRAGRYPLVRTLTFVTRGAPAGDAARFMAFARSDGVADVFAQGELRPGGALMPGEVLDRHFSARMLPLAALAGLVIAVAPPAAYRAIAWQKLRDRAQIYAGHVAASLRPLVTRQPWLWRFDADKVLEATAIPRAHPDIRRVRITDCDGRERFSPERPGDLGGVEGPEGWAPVLSGGETVAFVEVRTDASGERGALLLIALASGLLGLAMGLLLHRFPTRVVRRQAKVLEQTLQQLRGAEVALTDANRELSQRVDEAVGEVHQLSERVVGIQEEERRRIARDLHDSVGQTLTALQLELALARGRPEEGAAHLAEASRCSDEALRDVRRVVHDLRPPELASAPLPEILRAYTERFEVRTGTAASFRLTGSGEPSEEVATCILRVLQEALTNVARHAKASEVGVCLELGAEQAVLEVFDDGQGFEPQASASAGSGLRGIRERCAFLGGTMELTSTRDGGETKLRVRLPLRRRNA